MNIQLNYLYRDGANYKAYGEEVFSNQQQLSLEYVEQIIRSHLIDGQWFYASKWTVKDLHFSEWDSDVDHEWHEYMDVESTTAATTKGDIAEFLSAISKIPR